MCQRVYIASPVELRAVRRSSRDPYLEVAPVSDVPTIRAFLRADLPFLYLAGGHVGCGCGFPSETADAQPDPKKLDQADLASLTALAEYVRRACRTDAALQLYLCWAGEESEAPESRRSVSLDHLCQPGFRLKHRQILTVRRTLEVRPRRTSGPS
jgi:hypothetical protein